MGTEGGTVTRALADIMRRPREEGGRPIRFILRSRLPRGNGHGSEGGNQQDLRSTKRAGVLANLCPIRVS